MYMIAYVTDSPGAPTVFHICLFIPGSRLTSTRASTSTRDSGAPSSQDVYSSEPPTWKEDEEDRKRRWAKVHPDCLDHIVSKLVRI